MPGATSSVLATHVTSDASATGFPGHRSSPTATTQDSDPPWDGLGPRWRAATCRSLAPRLVLVGFRRSKRAGPPEIDPAFEWDIYQGPRFFRDV